MYRATVMNHFKARVLSREPDKSIIRLWVKSKLIWRESRRTKETLWN